MAHLYLPWGTGNNRYTDRLQVRNQFASSLDLHDQTSYEYQDTEQRQRSPSLPPIRNIEPTLSKEETRKNKETLNRNLSGAKRFAFYDEDAEGDTSGYGSETLNMSIGRTGLHGRVNPVVAWQQKDDNNRY